MVIDKNHATGDYHQLRPPSGCSADWVVKAFFMGETFALLPLSKLFTCSLAEEVALQRSRTSFLFLPPDSNRRQQSWVLHSRPQS